MCSVPAQCSRISCTAPPTSRRRGQEFFTILDAELVALDGSGRDWDTPVLMLARRHIRLIVPASDGA
jgi:hypothetical protein